MDKYLFKSERLGFRNWKDSDIEILTAINSDPEVMKFFPSIQDKSATQDFIKRMISQFEIRGYTYFAVETLETIETIGFIGLSWQDFKSKWTPFVDIGWRLGQSYWAHGYATEGARRVLEYAAKNLKLSEVYSVAPKVNLPSIKVMQKIGMQKVGEFAHPRLLQNEKLKNCVVYKIDL